MKIFCNAWRLTTAARLHLSIRTGMRFISSTRRSMAAILLLHASLLATAAIAQNPALKTSDNLVSKTVQVGTSVALVANVFPDRCETTFFPLSCSRICFYKKGLLQLRETGPQPAVLATGRTVPENTIDNKCGGISNLTFSFNVNRSAATHAFVADLIHIEGSSIKSLISNNVNVTWSKINSITTVEPLGQAVAGSVQVRAQVVPLFASGPIPSGTLSFVATSQGRVFRPISDNVAVDNQGVAVATFALPTSSTSTSVTATYSGDTNLNTSSGQTTVPKVTKVLSSTSSVVATPPLVASHTSVALKASVMGFAPTGRVNFKKGNTVIASTTSSNTSATNGSTIFQTTVQLPPGTHNLVASYLGDVNNLPSVSSIPLQFTVIISATDLAALINIIDSILLASE